MLPMLAMLVAGLMAKQGMGAGAQPQAPQGGGLGGLGGLLGGLLGGQGAGRQAGAPGLASMLDLDGNGNPLDDIMRMAGKAMR